MDAWSALFAAAFLAVIAIAAGRPGPSGEELERREKERWRRS